MIFNNINNIYISQYDDININNINLMKNKLFCTFIPLEEMSTWIGNMFRSYDIMFNKIFILQIINNNEYVCTYNIEPGNYGNLPENTILVHRKKDTNTLYTINALNELIKSLNEGIIDERFIINWYDYRNTILLTHEGELKQLKTKIYQIIEK